MAKQASVNVIAAEPGEAVYNLMTVLIAAGWTHVASSDGTTFSTVSNQITAASDLNQDAFFVLEDPGGRRQYAFQRGNASGSQWLILYSALDGFTTGGDATTVPSATDEVEIKGNGARAAATWFGDTANIRTHAVAEDSPTGDVYPFWIVSMPVGVVTVENLMWVAPLIPGSFPAEASPATPSTGDADPCLVCAVSSGVGALFGGTTNYFGDVTSNAYGWFKYNYAGEEEWVNFMGTNSGGADFNAPGNLGNNPYTEGVDLLPCIWYRPVNGFSQQQGFKGITDWIKWTGINRQWPETVGLATDAHIHLNDLALPWPENVQPLL